IGQYVEAEAWCGQALEILSLLPSTLVQEYKPVMQKGYAEVLSKVSDFAEGLNFNLQVIPKAD
ncbi:hypothetical protein SARC_09009, partial [Sphaeroforma arctica JP610]